MLDPLEQQDITEKERQQLSTIIDPEIGRSIVEMGLIYLVEIDFEGNVSIIMTTTTKGCPAAGFLAEAVKACLACVPGVRNVDVTLTYEPMWRPEMMEA